ncbi:MAG: M60 family metallopeptidase [Planctomycetota bacterium]|jgi:hypothetical protein
MRAALALLIFTAVSRAGDLEQLLDGVGEIGIGGVPGLLSVFGDEAFPVIAAPAAGRVAPIVAAARYGKGRVVVLSHGCWFDKRTMEVGDTRRLVENLFRWAGRAKPVGVRRNPHLAAVLEARTLEGAGWTGRLAGLGAVYAGTSRLSDTEVEALRAYVRGGGGFVTGVPGWGWQQLNPGKDLATQMPGNRLLAPAGIVFGRGLIQGRRKLKVKPPHAMLHAATALAAMQKQKKAHPLAATTLARCVADLPPGDTLLLPRIRRLAADRKPPVPPLGPGIDQVLLALQVRSSQRLPAAEVRALPAAAQFPGAVPPDAPRVTRTVSIDTSVPRWHSTGLYAAPGELVIARTKALGLKLRIGCHKDRLWDKPKWRRAPAVTRVFALDAVKTPAASAFGGLLYVEVPRGRRGRVDVEITGAVEAPLFVLGAKNPPDWRAKPAPWAELATSKVIITVPSRHIRKLADAAALMRFWDRVMDACADLATIPRERASPERYVADEQISAGYMHAGYPIMTHLDAAPRFVDLGKLSTQGDWGMFHEMGHNHQHRDWTFQGTGEVTCNLFTLYVMETVCTAATGHKATQPEATRQRIARHRSGGRPFTAWKSQPFLALIMYRQLRAAFGWEAFKKVFAEYRDLEAADRPGDDAAKRDQWMMRFSRTVGRNLGPFFDDWGVPVSEAAKKAVADLPAWMPR